MACVFADVEWLSYGLYGVDECEIVVCGAHDEHSAAMLAAPIAVGGFEDDEGVAAAVIVEVYAAEIIVGGDGCFAVFEEVLHGQFEDVIFGVYALCGLGR